MSDNMTRWDAMAHPPADTLKKIGGGRLSGMTDIKPQWRYQAMTEQFGPCGVGWKYTVTRQWLEPGDSDQVVAFVNIELFVKVDDVWSDAIPGSGGSIFIENEKRGLHTSDEAYKMATTDALSVAMKMLGVGAAVYMGEWTGSKYKSEPQPLPRPTANRLNEVAEPEKPAGVASEMLEIIKGVPDAGGANWCVQNMKTKAWPVDVRKMLWLALVTRATEVGATWDSKFEAFV